MATQIPEAPQVPALGSSTFEDDMRNFHQWEKKQLQPNINLISSEVEDNKNQTESYRNETKLLRDETESLRDETLTYKNDVAQIKTDCETIKSDIQTIVATANYKGDWDSTITYNKGETVKYIDKLWISTVDNNLGNTPTVGQTTYWMVICDIENWILPIPTVTTIDINENSTGTHTISNYDSDANYYVSSSDPLITSISVSGDTITITTGGITDDIDHQVTYNIKIAKEGYLFNEANITFNVLYVPIIADDALLWEGTTYISDNFDTINDGFII